MSLELMPEQLDLFTERSTLNCIEDSYIEEYNQLNSLNETDNIEFSCLPHPDRYKVKK